MSPMQRILRERVYYYKRKRKQKNKKILNFKVWQVNKSPINFKRIIGLMLLGIGILLVFVKCSSGKEEISKEAKGNITLSYVAEVAKVPSAQVSYYEYFQDFHITNKEIKKLFKIALHQKQSFAHTLSVWTNEKFKGTSPEDIYKMIKKSSGKSVIIENSYAEGTELYEQFIYDIKYFPIEDNKACVYEDGWKQRRVFNGERKHYGIDIMDSKNITGRVKIVSMTSGIIENIGWNDSGGYRVGVRSKGGAYFYYAHLHEMPSHLEIGQKIQAGDYIGLMGNTGYGEEGTRGKFDVHLHIGIALSTKEDKEFWINPYYVLRYLEKGSGKK